MSLRIQAQPPAPCSENLLATMPAMIGAPSSSWITVSLEKPAVTFSISHVTRVKPSAFVGVAEQEAIGVHQLSRRVGFLDHAVDDDVRQAERPHLGRRVRPVRAARTQLVLDGALVARTSRVHSGDVMASQIACGEALM